MKKNDDGKEMSECYYDEDGIRETTSYGIFLFIILLFPLFWIACILYTINMLWKRTFFITREEYFKRRLEECKIKR